MTHKKTSLLIAAVAVMLLSATSAQAYYETWDGWFYSGNLYISGYTYTRVGTSTGSASDSSQAVYRDTFYSFTPNAGGIVFVCDILTDTIYLSISTMKGGKTTGQSGTKPGDGTWSGSALVRGTRHEPYSFTSVSGTWDTQDPPQCFDYTASPPTLLAGWDVTGSTPPGLSGYGTCNGVRTSP